MRSAPLALVVFLLSPATTAEAQNQFALDLDVLGLGFSWAHGGGDSWAIGVGAGVGLSVLHWTGIADDHFSDADEVGLDQVIHLTVFGRKQLGSDWTADVGLRGSLLIHGDSGGGGNPAPVLFVGPSATLLWGSRLKIGPTLHVGVASEGSTWSPAWRFVPLTGRFVL